MIPAPNNVTTAHSDGSNWIKLEGKGLFWAIAVDKLSMNGHGLSGEGLSVSSFRKCGNRDRGEADCIALGHHRPRLQCHRCSVRQSPATILTCQGLGSTSRLSQQMGKPSSVCRLGRSSLIIDPLVLSSDA